MKVHCIKMPLLNKLGFWRESFLHGLEVSITIKRTRHLDRYNRLIGFGCWFEFNDRNQRKQPRQSKKEAFYFLKMFVLSITLRHRFPPTQKKNVIQKVFQKSALLKIGNSSWIFELNLLTFELITLFYFICDVMWKLIHSPFY